MTNPTRTCWAGALASEAALSSVLEKALLLQRTLLTGKKEPNVAANELAVQAVDQENSALEQEINNLKTELELRRTLAGNSAMAIIQRHSTCAPARAASSRATPRATVCGSPEAAERYAMSRLAWLRLPWLFNRRVGGRCCGPCWWSPPRWR